MLAATLANRPGASPMPLSHGPAYAPDLPCNTPSLQSICSQVMMLYTS